MMRTWLSLWLPLAGIALLPVLSDYLANRYQVAAQDLLLPIIIQLLTATVIAGFFLYSWRHDNRAGALIGGLLVTAVLARPEPLFAQANNLIYQLRWRYLILLLPFIGFALFGIATFTSHLIGRGMQRLTDHARWPTIEQVRTLSAMAGFTFVLLAIPTVWDLATAWPQFSYQPPALPSLPASARAAPKPDIYYIVLDDYTNQEVLQKQLNFDNSSFMQFLQQNGYMTKPTAQSSYPYTTMSLASTLTASYLTDLTRKFGNSAEQTIIPFHQSIKESPVIQALKSIGYRYDLIGTWYDTTDTSPEADEIYQDNGQLTILGKQFTLNNFAIDEPVLSVWWGVIAKGIRIGNFPILSYTGQAHDEMTLASLEHLRDLVNQPAGGRFIFAHLLIPHDEYFFQPNGQPAIDSDANNVDESIQQKYTDQVRFINAQIEPILAQINQDSQNQAIVVLQSEEGPYPVEFNHGVFAQDKIDEALDSQNMLNWSTNDLQMKYGILAAYHIPQATPQDLTAAADSVNVFRLILNDYFGGTLAYLPECHYAYPAGRNHALSFADITQKLTGRPTPICQNYL